MGRRERKVGRPRRRSRGKGRRRDRGRKGCRLARFLLRPFRQHLHLLRWLARQPPFLLLLLPSCFSSLVLPLPPSLTPFLLPPRRRSRSPPFPPPLQNLLPPPKTHDSHPPPPSSLPPFLLIPCPLIPPLPPVPLGGRREGGREGGRDRRRTFLPSNPPSTGRNSEAIFTACSRRLCWCGRPLFPSLLSSLLPSLPLPSPR